MKKLLLFYQAHPLTLAGHAWGLWLASFVITYSFLPTAHVLYHGPYPFLGYVLHRSFMLLFLLAAMMAFLSFVLQLIRKAESVSQRIGHIVKGFLLSIPVVFLGSVAAFLLLVGHYIGLALG